MTQERRPLESLTMAKHCRHHDVVPSRIVERDGGHTCALGIDIVALVGGDRRGWLRRIPCFLPNKSEPSFVPCDKAEPHTQAELEARRDALETGAARMLASLPLIGRVKRERHGGEFPCPAPGCTGRLTIGYCPSNGHTTGSCTAANCYRWIE